MAILSTAARRRRERWRRIGFAFVKMAVAAAVLIVTAFGAFEAGTAKNEENIRRLQAELVRVEDEQLALVAARETAQERLRRMAATLAELETDYRANVPEGEVAELLQVTREKLAEGLSSERLEFLLRSANLERVCDNSVETLPVLVRTPLSTIPNNSVGFADNRVVISADGQPRRLDDGTALGFFDATQAIAIRFLMVNGEIERLTQRIPVAHSVVLDDDEYQFQILPSGEEGYVSITARRCDYP